MKIECEEEVWCTNTAKYKVGHPVCSVHLVKACRRVIDLTRAINGQGEVKVGGL